MCYSERTSKCTTSVNRESSQRPTDSELELKGTNRQHDGKMCPNIRN